MRHNMKLEVRVRINISETISPEELSEITENVKFLAKQPLLKVFSHFKGKEINYDGGYREIKVSRGFESVKVTKKMELERGWEEGLYNYSCIEYDFFNYWVWDFADVKGMETYPGSKTSVGMEAYLSQEEVRELEKRRKIKPSG